MHAGPQKKRPSPGRIVYPRACIELNYTGVRAGAVWSGLHKRCGEANDARTFDFFIVIPLAVMVNFEHSAWEYSTVRLPSNLPTSIRFHGSYCKRCRRCHRNLSKEPSWCAYIPNNRSVPRIAGI